MKQTLMLRDERIRQNAINIINSLLTDKDRPVTIRISDYKRNLDQNAKFHALLGDIARQAEWCGKKLKPEQWKVCSLAVTPSPQSSRQRLFRALRESS
ncbi:NinB protein [Buttiauxella sp. JUb87]|nr:NinB protein [Buttiauxella sp. JUb87]